MLFIINLRRFKFRKMSAGTQILYFQVNAVRFSHNYLQSKNIFSNTLRFLSSDNVNDQVSHPYKTKAKL